MGTIQKSKNIEKSEKKKYKKILFYNKDIVKSLVTVTSLIQITVKFQFHYFVLILILFSTLILWLQFRQRGFLIIIGSKFITTTVFKLNMKTLIPA